MHNHQELIESLKEVTVDELDHVLEELEQEVQEPEASIASPSMDEQILQLLHGRSDAPGAQQIREWKERFGDQGVQVWAASRSQVYIFTHVTGRQWDKIQSLQEKLQGQPAANTTASRKIRDTVLRTCILWPKLDDQWFQDGPAGLPDTLFGVVTMSSYFLSPQQAMALTTTL